MKLELKTNSTSIYLLVFKYEFNRYNNKNIIYNDDIKIKYTAELIRSHRLPAKSLATCSRYV